MKVLLKSKLSLILICCVLSSCMNQYAPTPKKKAYFRVDFPEKSFKKFESESCPYTFEYPAYAKVNQDIVFFDDLPSDPCWANIEFKQFNAKLHLSYKEIQSKYDIDSVLEDTWELTQKHTIRAQFIDEFPIHEKENVDGMYYSIGGNAASAVQFYLTDSNRHFLRASLYFRNRPNVDSLKEVLDFIEFDVIHFTKTFEWTN